MFQHRSQVHCAMLLVIALAGSLLFGGVAAAAATTSTTVKLPGYLAKSELPNSRVIIPPPPAEDSAALSLDEDIARRTFEVRDTARFVLARSDYDLSFPHAAGVYSCTLNAPITEQDTPVLYRLLRRVRTDASDATKAAKSYYQRPRPFMVNHEPLCSPETAKELAKGGSYPSGHTSIGWAWALVLAEISPADADAILWRGRAYGESRNVCNHHWYSDVEWGRVIAAATVARLHTKPEFLADLAAAKAELAAVRAKGLAPTRNCVFEAEALSIQPY